MGYGKATNTSQCEGDLRTCPVTRAHAIVIHGRSDTMIPYSESLALARVLPPELVQLFLIEGFAHADAQPERGDIPQLLSAMEALLGSG